MKEKIENCVVLNIYVECDKRDEKYDNCCKKEEEEDTCIEINVYVDCKKKKMQY